MGLIFTFKRNSMFTIENEVLKVIINPKGAELTSLYRKDLQQEYMWSGDAAFWGKHSPILFPIVGTLKENTYFYNNQPYQLSRHGFARDKQFAVDKQAFDAISFLLKQSDDTLKVFPFSFDFYIRYTLAGNALSVSYDVINTGKEDMYFSVGGHPAFKVPLTTATTYDDYFLEFNQEETAPRWPISPDGLIESNPLPLLQQTSRLPLTKALFQQDAVVLKGLRSSKVSLLSAKTERGLQFDFPGFPFLGIWAAKNADFVCIEPWCGIADSVNTDQLLENKEGINKLPAGSNFTRTWTVATL
ncbi:MAG: aldose 1-epimerase family protein [Chitinophagaceae bacterium]